MSEARRGQVALGSLFGVLSALVLVALVIAAVLIARRRHAAGVTARGCCSSGAWPPDDLHAPAPGAPVAQRTTR